MNKRITVFSLVLMMAIAFLLVLNPSKARAEEEEKNGWYEEEGHMRYYENGYMFKDRGLNDLDDNGWTTEYYFDDDGYMVTGFYKTPGGDGRYLSYFGTDGKRWTKDGWNQIDGYWYYITHGYVAAGKNGYFELADIQNMEILKIGGAYYGFDEYGHMITGWFKATMPYTTTTSDGGWTFVRTETGNIKTRTTWWYFEKSGKAKTGWIQSGKNWYYIYEGEALTGEVYIIDGKKYCFNDIGVMVTNQWVKHESVSGAMLWFYFRSDGTIAKDCWVQHKGKWYYFEGENYVTGWKQISGKWYYFNFGGDMVTGWKQISGKWYFFKPSGAMAAKEWCGGYWLNADGTWTYKYKASWKKDSKGWYYQDTSGWYAKNTTIRIDDKLYTFDAKGYMQ